MKSLGACFAILVTLAVPAASQQDNCAVLTHQALELSGLNQSITEMTRMLNSDQFMKQVSRGQNADPDFFATFRPIMMKDFDGSVMRNELETRVSAQCDPAKLSQAVAAMKSPLVSKMLAVEADAGKTENLEKNNRCVRAAEILPPPDDRMDAIAALDESSGTSELAVDAMIVMTRGMLNGAGIHFNGADYLERHRQELKLRKSKDVEISMLCTYKSVSRTEILQYARELRSEPLKTFYDRAKQAFLEVLEERARAAGADLKTVMTASAR